MPDTVSEARVVFAEELLRSMQQMPYVLVTLSIPVILLLVFAGVTIFRAVSDGPDQEQTEVMTASLTGVVNLSVDLNLPAPFPRTGCALDPRGGRAGAAGRLHLRAVRGPGGLPADRLPGVAHCVV